MFFPALRDSPSQAFFLFRRSGEAFFSFPQIVVGFRSLAVKFLYPARRVPAAFLALKNFIQLFSFAPDDPVDGFPGGEGRAVF